MGKRILVVDDSASVRTVAGIALREAGYEVLEAANGQEGLSRLNGERIHLVISDVNMPILDGIGFLKQIKAHPNYRFTPVIMLTTESLESKKKEGQAAGVRAWVTKPFQPPVLLSAVEKLVLP